MNATAHYTRNTILTASPQKLVVLMYDGAIRYARQAIVHMDRGDVASCGTAIGKAFNVISELKVSLDADAAGPDGRAIIDELSRLYAFAMDRLVAANSKRRREDLTAVIETMEILRGAWAEIAAC